MAYCKTYEDLQEKLISIRSKQRWEFAEAVSRGASEEEQEALIARDTPEEIKAIFAVLDHMAEHGCQREHK